MALKAGYVGVKKSLISIIKSLASSVIIKEVGDGLEYDSETGELSALSGANVKKLEYTGTGTGVNSIVFDEIPSCILGIICKTDVDTAGYIASIQSFVYGAAISPIIWRTQASAQTNYVINLVSYSSDKKTLTITGSDAGQAMNRANNVYEVYYI